MKIGIFIDARVGSSRLPEKHLRTVAGKPILQYLLDRILHKFKAVIESGDITLAITTSQSQGNEKFEVLRSELVKVFRGSPKNIPLRHLQASTHFGVDAMVLLGGDNILCSTWAMSQVEQSLRSGHEYVLTKGLPIGMNAFGYSKKFLEQYLRGKEDEIIETGWLRIFPDEKLFLINVKPPDQSESLRFTMDYPEDYQFFKTIIETYPKNLLDASDKELFDFVKQNELYKINKSLSDEYWERFYRLRSEES
jgi:spore coat polysaccharide biosynthesis protein SpsF (cytidylyltransferase family)